MISLPNVAVGLDVKDQIYCLRYLAVSPALTELSHGVTITIYYYNYVVV